MDPRLKAIADDATARDRERLNECLGLIAEKGFPQKLADGVPEARQLVPLCQKIAAQAGKSFPVAMGDMLRRDLDGRRVRAGDLIQELWRDYLAPMEKYTNLPARLEERVESIRAMTPADVKRWTIDSIARGQIEHCETLMSQLKSLRELPEKVSEQVKLIRQQLDICPAEGRTATTCNPPPSVPSETPDKWDSRL